MSVIKKKLNEKTPDLIKRILSPLIRTRLIKNSNFKTQYKMLDTINFENIENLNRLQLIELKNVLIHAYETTVYYKELFDSIKLDPYSINKLSDIEKIPILTKEMVRKNQEQLFSSESISFYKAKTGGTTGIPLELLMDSSSIYRERAFVYHHWSKLGYNYKTSKIMTFRGIDVKNKVYKLNPIYNEIILSPFYINDHRIMEYINIIQKFKPDFFTGYPSAISNFCNVIRKNNLQCKINIKGVFFISEEVSENDIKIVQEVLKCPTSTFYGHSERVVFAEESHNQYQFNKLYGYTELIPTDIPNEYEIISTGFINKKMPLIRYKTGDIAIKSSRGYLIKGRSNDMFVVGINGERISMASKVFHEGLFSTIIGYQFVQNEKGKVMINVLSNDDKLTMKKLENQVNQALQGIISFNVSSVESLQLTPRGKFNILIQNLK